MDGIVRIKVSDLSAFIARVMEAVGLPPEDAGDVGALMAEADARGTDAHGIFRLPHYVQRIQSGGINTRPSIRVVKERPAAALLDGDNGMGHLVMKRAAALAIEKAREAGVAWVGVRNSNHAGPAQLYARMPAAQNMIGLYLCVGNANHMPPWGGATALLSTNPIAIAMPGYRHPAIVLDMATTNAAYGKVKLKRQNNEPMPENWMIDRSGRALTDPARAGEGFLVPLGGPKGYGLALMFGMLAGTLNGAAFGKDVIDFNADLRSATNTGHSILAIDITAFADLQWFKEKSDDIWDQMKGAAKLPGVSEIFLPGERSARIYDDRTENGVPLGPELLRRLDELANELKMPRLSDVC